MKLILVAAVLTVLGCSSGDAAEWQKVRDFPFREINLTEGQPGVDYDEGSYKFYVTDQHYLRHDQALMLTARSWYFQPDILVWNSNGQVIGRCKEEAPYPDPNDASKTVYGCTVEVNQPPEGNYSVVTTTRDINQGPLSLVGSLWQLPGEGVATDNPTRGNAATTDPAIRRCQDLTGSDRTDCLVRLSATALDPTPCDFDPTGSCRPLAAIQLTERCQTLSDQLKREACFLEVATNWKDVGPCNYAQEFDHCYLSVAAEMKNPQMVVDRFGSGPDADNWLAMYGTLSGDLFAAELIHDNQKADYATIMIGMILIARGAEMPPNLCDGLRGDYEDEFNDLSVEAMADLCARSVVRARDLVARLEGASEEEWQRIVADFLRETEELADGDGDDGSGGSGGSQPPPPPGGGGTSGDMPCVSLLGQSDDC